MRNRKTGIAEGGGAADGRFWDGPGLLGARRRLRQYRMSAEQGSNKSQFDCRAFNALPKQHAEPPTRVVRWRVGLNVRRVLSQLPAGKRWVQDSEARADFLRDCLRQIQP